MNSNTILLRHTRRREEERELKTKNEENGNGYLKRYKKEARSPDLTRFPGSRLANTVAHPESLNSPTVGKSILGITRRPGLHSARRPFPRELLHPFHNLSHLSRTRITIHPRSLEHTHHSTIFGPPPHHARRPPAPPQSCPSSSTGTSLHRSFMTMRKDYSARR